MSEEPEFQKVGRFLLSEVVTYVIIGVVAVTVVFGMVVSSERDDMVTRAEDAITAIEDQLAAAASNQTLITCDNNMIASDLMANDYISFETRPLPIDPSDSSAGFGATLHFESTLEKDGNEILDTTKRLYERLQEDEAYTLVKIAKKKDVLVFDIQFTDYPVCAATSA